MEWAAAPTAAAAAAAAASTAWPEPCDEAQQQQPCWPPLLVVDHTLPDKLPWQQQQQQQQLLSPPNSDDRGSPEYHLDLLVTDDDVAGPPPAAAAAAAAGSASASRAAGSSGRQQLGQGGGGGGGAGGSGPRPSGASTKALPAAPAAHAKGGPRVKSKATTPAQREAHKRYRERKKQSIAAMEQEVAEKQQQLQALLAEHAQLKSRERVLETAKRCSTEIFELMHLLNFLPSLVVDDEGVADSALVTTDVDAAEDKLKRAVSLGGNSYLQRLLQDPAAAAAAATPAAALPAAGGAEHQQGDSQQQQEPLSMQVESHWLQLAEQYVRAAGANGSDVAAAASGDDDDGAEAATEEHRLAAAAPESGSCRAGSGSAAADTGAASSSAASGSVADARSGGSIGSNSSSSMSRLLSEVGSVDTAEQGLVVYQAFLRHAEQMLAQAQQERSAGDEAGAAATEAKVGQLMRSTIARLQPFLVAHGQGVVYAWGALNLATQEPEEPPASLWPAVLDALALSHETELDVLACYDLFGAPLTRLLDERAELVAAYRALQDAHALQDSTSMAAASTLEAFSVSRYQHEDNLKAIAANLERYQSLDGVFAHSLTNLLSGAQVAAACVASYPFLPRWHTIVSALKQRRSAEQEAAELEEEQRKQRRSTRQRVPSRFSTSVLYV